MCFAPDVVGKHSADEVRHTIMMIQKQEKRIHNYAHQL